MSGTAIVARVLVAFFAILGAGSALAGCPPHSALSSVTTEGNVRNVYCRCISGYEPEGSACVATRHSTQANCVRRAGRRLSREMKSCEASGRACLSRAGIGRKAAKCAASLFFASAKTAAIAASAPPAAATVGYLNLGKALTRCSLDARSAERAALRCEDRMDRCRVARLKAFDKRTRACRR